MSENARKQERALALLRSFPLAPSGLLGGGHMQTVYQPLFRRNEHLPLEQLAVRADDGESLELHITEPEMPEPGAPVVLIAHGLEGNQHSPYLRGLQIYLRKKGWGSACLVHRSCGGRLNSTVRTYHSGETGDISSAAYFLSERYPGRPLCVVGYSLSGNQVAKWLGAGDATVPPSVVAAASVSPPFDLNVTSKNIDTVLMGVYRRYFLKTLIPKAHGKAKKHPGALDLARIKKIRTLYDFDDVVTSRLHGFAGARDYYQRVAWPQFAAGLKRPLLLIAAEDDPFSPASSIPDPLRAAQPWLHALIVKKGGHVGFIGGSLLSPSYWSEAQLHRFFEFYWQSSLR